jgi:hypothetical protein
MAPNKPLMGFTLHGNQPTKGGGGVGGTRFFLTPLTCYNFYPQNIFCFESLSFVILTLCEKTNPHTHTQTVSEIREFSS